MEALAVTCVLITPAVVVARARQGARAAPKEHYAFVALRPCPAASRAVEALALPRGRVTLWVQIPEGVLAGRNGALDTAVGHVVITLAHAVPATLGPIQTHPMAGAHAVHATLQQAHARDAACRPSPEPIANAFVPARLAVAAALGHARLAAIALLAGVTGFPSPETETRVVVARAGAVARTALAVEAARELRTPLAYNLARYAGVSILANTLRRHRATQTAAAAGRCVCAASRTHHGAVWFAKARVAAAIPAVGAHPLGGAYLGRARALLAADGREVARVARAPPGPAGAGVTRAVAAAWGVGAPGAFLARDAKTAVRTPDVTLRSAAEPNVALAAGPVEARPVPGAEPSCRSCGEQHVA